MNWRHSSEFLTPIFHSGHTLWFLCRFDADSAVKAAWPLGPWVGWPADHPSQAAPGPLVRGSGWRQRPVPAPYPIHPHLPLACCLRRDLHREKSPWGGIKTQNPTELSLLELGCFLKARSTDMKETFYTTHFKNQNEMLFFCHLSPLVQLKQRFVAFFNNAFAVKDSARPV